MYKYFQAVIEPEVKKLSELLEPRKVKKIEVKNESRIVHLTACRQYTGGIYTKELKRPPKVTTVLTVPYWYLEEIF